MKPLISVIMSVRNQDSQYLNQSITSILNQSLTSFRFIIVDDASTKKHKKDLYNFKDSRIKIIENSKKLGIAKSLNKALKIVSTKYIARMDSDDISDLKRLAIQLKFLESNPSISVCGSDFLLINQKGIRIKKNSFPHSYHQIKKSILKSNPIRHPSVMIRMSTLKKLGFYDPQFNGAEDYELWLRIAAKYPVVNINKPLLKFRVNPKSVSWVKTKKMEKQAIKARLKALTHYNYPSWQAIYLLKPILSLFVPTSIKKWLFNIH